MIYVAYYKRTWTVARVDQDAVEFIPLFLLWNKVECFENGILWLKGFGRYVTFGVQFYCLDLLKYLSSVFPIHTHNDVPSSLYSSDKKLEQDYIQYVNI